MIIEGNADIHIATHAEGGRIVIKGNVNRRIGGQMVKGEVIVFGAVNVMMPGFHYNQDVELTVDGVTAMFQEYIGDLGERHPKRKGEPVYGKLYLKNNFFHPGASGALHANCIFCGSSADSSCLMRVPSMACLPKISDWP